MKAIQSRKKGLDGNVSRFVRKSWVLSSVEANIPVTTLGVIQSETGLRVE